MTPTEPARDASRDAARRPGLVAPPRAPPAPAPARRRRAGLRVGAVLQRARSARALQHARHAEGPVHRVPDRGARAVLGHGTGPLLDRRRRLRLARHDLGDRRRGGGARALRRRFVPGAAQRLSSQRPRQPAGRAGQARPRQARRRLERELLRRASPSTTAGALAWRPGNSRPGASVELRFEMDTLVVLSNTPHPLDPEHAIPAAAGRAVDQRRATARPRTIAAGCRGPKTGAASQLTEAYAAEMAGAR